VTLKLAVSRSRPPVPCWANLFLYFFPFFFVPCARLSWPFCRVLSARKYTCTYLVSHILPSACVAPATVRISGVEAVRTLDVRRTVVHTDSIHLRRQTHRLQHNSTEFIIYSQTSAQIATASSDAITSYICRSTSASSIYRLLMIRRL